MLYLCFALHLVQVANDVFGFKLSPSLARDNVSIKKVFVV